MADIEDDVEKGYEAPLREIADQFGNIFYIKEELNRGGQGVVYRTTDKDVAIKQPIKQPGGELDYSPELIGRYSKIRTLPLPKGIHLTTPLSILRDQPGYVMRLLGDMKALSKVFRFGGQEKKSVENEAKPGWLSAVKDQDAAMQLMHYAKTGGARSRLEILYLAAAQLARLHLSGLVYGDVSDDNIFIGRNADGGFDRLEAWLIDVDNLRLERTTGGRWSYTDPFGAPEIVQRREPCRPRTDCWSFAVMAFKMLTLSHPFIGKKVMDDTEEEDDWASDPVQKDSSAMPLIKQANSGLLPYINDPEDDSNAYNGKGLHISLVSSKALQWLFLETFGPGRVQPCRRPGMALWALELAKAYDLSMTCPGCGMSYIAKENVKCPFCDKPRPAFFVAKMRDRGWEKVLFDGKELKHPLPHRIFHPFSLARCADVEYEAEIDTIKGIVRPSRGTKSFPMGLEFEFVAAVQEMKGAGS